MAALIHIHEDDWSMRALHPAECWSEVSDDVETAAAHGAAHRASDGVGWTSAHLIRQPTVDFSAKGVLLEPLARRLGALMPRVSRFYATAGAGFDLSRRDPYGSYDENALAFGFDAGCFIKLEPKGEVLARVWFEARTRDDLQLKALREALLAVDSAAPCIVVDYWADVAGVVRDAAFMARYFAWLGGA